MIILLTCMVRLIDAYAIAILKNKMDKINFFHTVFIKCLFSFYTSKTCVAAARIGTAFHST